MKQVRTTGGSTERYKVFGTDPGSWFVAAAANSDFQAMKGLIAQGTNVSVRDPRYDRTALHAACNLGLKRVVEFLLQRNCPLNELDGNGMTPLMCACSTGKTKGSAIAIRLLEAGADATPVREEDGMTAYKFALWGDCSAVVLTKLLASGASHPEEGFRVVRLA